MMFVEIDEFDICVILGMWFIIFYNCLCFLNMLCRKKEWKYILGFRDFLVNMIMLLFRDFINFDSVNEDNIIKDNKIRDV